MTQIEIIAPDEGSLDTDIASASTADLHAALRREIEITAHSIARMARIWHELHTRGEDLSHLRSGIARYLPRVAAGQVVPEAVVALAGNGYALQAVASLTPDEQRRVLAERTITVCYGPDDTPTSIALHRLRQPEIARAFDRVSGTVRTLDEQRALPPPKKRSRRGHVSDRVTVLLTRDERSRLELAAKRRNVSLSEYVRSILADNGAL